MEGGERSWFWSFLQRRSWRFGSLLYVTNSDDLGTRKSIRLSRVDAWEKFDLTILDRTVVAG